MILLTGRPSLTMAANSKMLSSRTRGAGTRRVVQAQRVRSRTRGPVQVRANAKQLHFNVDGEAIKKMQNGVEKLAKVVGVTLGPKGRNVVLETKFGLQRL